MTRVLSAVVLLALLIATVWLLPAIWTLAVAELVALLAFLEYAALAAALGAHVPRLIGGAAVLATCAATGVPGVPVEIVLMTAVIVTGALAVAGGQPGGAVLRDTAAAILPILYIGLPLGALAAVRAVGGRMAILVLFVVMVVSDSAQYYTGRAMGRRPLAPAISPKKTVEGAIGGLVLGTAAMIVAGRLAFGEPRLELLAVLGAAVVALGIVGDLFESLLKRSAGVKDSSTLIPGHGGVLDRIDSWLFAAPAYYVFVRYLQ
ncbi:MAG TPA: phosphatidate cytidylyltransferase [Vicinamibacterales bacterium]